MINTCILSFTQWRLTEAREHKKIGHSVHLTAYIYINIFVDGAWSLGYKAQDNLLLVQTMNSVHFWPTSVCPISLHDAPIGKFINKYSIVIDIPLLLVDI